MGNHSRRAPRCRSRSMGDGSGRLSGQIQGWRQQCDCRAHLGDAWDVGDGEKEGRPAGSVGRGSPVAAAAAQSTQQCSTHSQVQVLAWRAQRDQRPAPTPQSTLRSSSRSCDRLCSNPDHRPLWQPQAASQFASPHPWPHCGCARQPSSCPRSPIPTKVNVVPCAGRAPGSIDRSIVRGGHEDPSCPACPPQPSGAAREPQARGIAEQPPLSPLLQVCRHGVPHVLRRRHRG